MPSSLKKSSIFGRFEAKRRRHIRFDTSSTHGPAFGGEVRLSFPWRKEKDTRPKGSCLADEKNDFNMMRVFYGSSSWTFSHHLPKHTTKVRNLICHEGMLDFYGQKRGRGFGNEKNMWRKNKGIYRLLPKTFGNDPNV